MNTLFRYKRNYIEVTKSKNFERKSVVGADGQVCADE